ncbi:hypothetical protein [Salinactinospora qingdaonensis]|uniref:hypothetical protein n=1 Tax=Salinactinospora qingdaonensis TaxID=702744 RepID=UPI0031EC9E2A
MTEQLCGSLRDSYRICQARDVLAMADPRAESPGESWVRCLVVDAGLPRPQCQIPLSGGKLRLDMGYPQWRQAVEYDGWEHHRRTARQAELDEERRRRIAAEGWRVLVVTAETVLCSPEDFLWPLRDRLLGAGWQPPRGWLSVVRRRINYIGMKFRQARETGTLHLL